MEWGSESTGRSGQPKYRRIERAQGQFVNLFIEHLVEPGHAARLIWELVGRLDLRGFEGEIASREREAGRPCWPPRLLISVWVYGYMRGTASARELERQMEWEPGLRWLCAMEVVNHHTLSDFRLQNAERLKEMPAQVPAVLAGEQMVDFGELPQDGTKMKAQAGRQSFHRKPTLSRHLEQARACVAELERRAGPAGGAGAASEKRSKKEAAQERAGRERLKRMEAAMAEMERRQAKAAAADAPETRVSESEAEAFKMKHAHGGWEPSYNLQLVTEGKNGFIVGVSVSNSAGDQHQLKPALEVAQECTGRAPATVIADGGYANRGNVEQLAKAGIALIAPWKSDENRQAGSLARHGVDAAFAAARFERAADGQTLVCPAGAALVSIGKRKVHGLPVERFQAPPVVCGACPRKLQCCPKRPARVVDQVLESKPVKQYLERMAQPETQALYKKRGRIAEYPNMKIKSAWGIPQFSLRGLAKATQEAFWLALAFNVNLWLLLKNRAAVAA